MKKIVIASACRTAIGKFGGTLANVPAVELGSIVIKEALNRANVKPEQVDHVYMGCVIQAGLGQNVARQASLKAGLPIETPAVTVNVVCGSGLNCVNMAAQMIEAGDADIVVAGGMENMDMAPFAMMKGRYGYRMGAPMGKSEIVDTMVNDALWDACGFNKHMGMTAENVCTNETYQKKYGYSPITREMLDEFSYNSQLKADKAIKDGAFKDEIVPVVIKGKKGDTVFDTDEGPRMSSMEVLGKLKPCFKKDGIVTAANSSAINDGAAALVIMSEEKAKELGVKVDMNYSWQYGASFSASPELQTMVSGWYSNGTQVVFACGGGIYVSIAEAAKKANAKIVGVDVDQAPIIDALANEDTTITSAMKGLASSTKAALKGIIEDGKWDELAGKIDNLGLVSGTDMDANYVGIPTGDGTAWCDTFTTDDYAALVAAMFDGTITVSNDITKKPADFATDITLTDLGTLN